MPTERPTERITFRLSPETRTRLIVLTQQHKGATLSDIVRDAVMARLDAIQATDQLTA